MENSNKIIVPAIVISLLVVLIAFFNPIAIVGVGERGVKVTLGKVSPTSYTEGIHFITPFISCCPSKFRMAPFRLTKEKPWKKVLDMSVSNLLPISEVHSLFKTMLLI